MTERCRMYLELHDISTGRRSNQTRAHILGLLVQYAHISWVLIVIHHLQAKTQNTQHLWANSGASSTEQTWIQQSFQGIFVSCISPWRQPVWSTAASSLHKIKFCLLCKQRWNKLIKTGFHSQHCILSLWPPHHPTQSPPPFLSPDLLSHCDHNKFKCTHFYCSSQYNWIRILLLLFYIFKWLHLHWASNICLLVFIRSGISIVFALFLFS